MQIGMIGLGKMGGNMSRRLMKAGHRCVVYARSAKSRKALSKDGATAAASIADLVKTLGSIICAAIISSAIRKKCRLGLRRNGSKACIWKSSEIGLWARAAISSAIL